MYRCDNCKNEYESQKRFLAHIERCGNRSVRSSESRKRDIDETQKSKSRVTSENMQAAIEKLMKDREKLKTQIKYLTNDMRVQSTTHKKEMKRAYDKFHDTLSSLTIEKDEEILEEVDRVRVQMFKEFEREKEKMHAEYTKKMSAEKKRVSNKSARQISHLESTVETLQERLSNLTTERTTTNELHDQQIVDREEFLQQQVSNLEDQVRTIREALEEERNKSRMISFTRSEDKIAIQREAQLSFDIERNEMRRIIDSYDADKANYKRQYEIEKAEALEILTIEARVLRDALSKAKDDMGRQALEAERVKREALLVQSVQHQDELRRRNDIAEKTRREHECQIESEHAAYEGKVTNLRLKYESERSKMVAELDNRMKGIELVYRNMLQAEHADADKRVEIISKELEEVKKVVVSLETTRTTNYAQLETALQEKTEMLANATDRADMALHKCTEMERDTTAKIMDLEQRNNTLTVHISDYKSAIAKLERDTIIAKDQYIFTLNNQRNEFLSYKTDLDIYKEKFSEAQTTMNALRQELDDTRSLLVTQHANAANEI